MTRTVFPRSGVVVRTTCHAALFFLTLAPTIGAELGFRFCPAEGQRPQRIEVTGLPASELQRFTQADTRESRQAVFRVSVVRDAGKPARPMLGTYSVSESVVAFTPRFPLRRGVRYRAEWTTADKQTLSKAFLEPVVDKTPPVVTHVYPSQNVLPENQLKFYLHFSRPMQQGGAYAHIRLIETGSGKQVTTPFLELGEELWDASGKRLTLYFDPGRIKRGLQPRQIFGPTLEAGKTYKLVIADSWKDAAAGLPLAKPYEKSFRAVAPDQTMPDHKRWKVRSPASGTRDLLRVELDEPLDHAMLLRVIELQDPAGENVSGEPAVGKGETAWMFEPDKPWVPGIYTLKVDRTLEDRAGNSLGRPFEVDVIRRTTERVEDETATVRFRVR